MLQLDEALSFRPRDLVLSVYFGNDFADAFNLSTRVATIAALVSPALARAGMARERQSPLAGDVDVLFRRADPSPTAGARTLEHLRAFLSSHSRLYGLAHTAKDLLLKPPASSSLLARDFDTAVRGLSPIQRQYCLIVDRPGWRTILTPPYRARVLDDGDVRIREGIEIVKAALSRVAQRSRDAGVQLVVVLIPTKESVFWPHTDDTDGGLSRLASTEDRLKAELTTHLMSGGIAFVDVTRDLRQADEQPYFGDADGHPNEAGHRLIADAIVRRLRMPDLAPGVRPRRDAAAAPVTFHPARSLS